MVLLGAIVGACLFLLTLHFLQLRTAAREDRKRESIDPNPAHRIILDAATIADDLIPRFSPHVTQSSKITIVGSDAFYAQSKNGKVLIGGIRSWLSRGASVDYILLHDGVDKRVVEAFANLVADFPKRFNLLVLKDEDCTTEIRSLRETYMTFHPTLLRGKDVAAMWIEGCHEPGSRYAYDVEFVSPRAMNKEKFAEFSKYRRDIEKIRRHCTNLHSKDLPQPKMKLAA